MTRDQIIEVVSAFKSAMATAKKHGLRADGDISNVSLDDLITTADIYGTQVRTNRYEGGIYHAVRIGEVTLFS